MDALHARESRPAVRALRRALRPRWLATVGSLLWCLAPGCDDHEVRPAPQSPPSAVVYAGPGAWRGSITAILRMFAWMGIDAREIDAAGIRGGGLAGADLVCFPGGDMYQYARDLGEPGVQEIRAFVAGGGGYIGICGGAYFSARRVIWQGRVLPMRSLGIFPGTSQGPIDEISPYPECTMCEVRIADHNHPITQAAPDSASILYCYGPSLVPVSEDSVAILARYAISRLPAAVAATFGEGRAFLIGTHPEIEEDDDRDGTPEYSDFEDRGSDWPLMQAAAGWCVGR